MGQGWIHLSSGTVARAVLQGKRWVTVALLWGQWWVATTFNGWEVGCHMAEVSTTTALFREGVSFHIHCYMDRWVIRHLQIQKVSYHTTVTWMEVSQIRGQITCHLTGIISGMMFCITVSYTNQILRKYFQWWNIFCLCNEASVKGTVCNMLRMFFCQAGYVDRQQSLSVDDRLGQRMSPISPNSSQASSGHSYGRQLSVQELFAGVKHLAFESPFIYENNYLNISYGK